MISFASHSAARKTLDTYTAIKKYPMQWVKVSGEITGDVVLNREEPFSLFSEGHPESLPDF